MANPPITIGSFDNVPAPGSPIKSDWAQEITRYVGDMTHGPISYTPVLTGMAIGSGGVAGNTAEYVYVGDPVGAGYPPGHGLMFARGSILFGTSGATFPTSPTVGLPPGFSWTTSARRAGVCEIEDAGVGYLEGVLQMTMPDKFTIQRLAVSGSNIAPAQITPTTPFTWAAADGFRWIVFGAAVQHT